MSAKDTVEVQVLLDQLENASENEARLFRLYLDVEDLDLDGQMRSDALQLIGTRIDDLRTRRGLPPDPGFDELLATYDGRPPATVEEVRRDHPEAIVSEATRFEMVGGRMRLFPVVTVRVAAGHFELYPEPSAQVRAWKRKRRESGDA